MLTIPAKLYDAIQEAIVALRSEIGFSNGDEAMREALRSLEDAMLQVEGVVVPFAGKQERSFVDINPSRSN